jgi:hypothetical protein
LRGYEEMLKSRIYCIINAVRIGFAALKHPDVFASKNISLLVALWEYILKVVHEGKPYVTNVVLVEISTGESRSIVSVWAGAGEGASVIERCRELSQENIELRKRLAEMEKYVPVYRVKGK